ncbi:hypothetical protein CHLRE_10g432200v5 [Chlamydomonas reinhardtii]|uniref:S1 motif domain-containing protein n=1 Tax=Chlamydomonas reinhardtii TaxID=3055 RepID=A8IB56_CHLRE|nr:uncharacterized protein CHLRE_10g432200v5 [Chlamydomonas reinhardtii]PNW77337.1 hypothetical protein CHLRE_10g432200v5 [Chlamydomonas reinhardtii]7PKQ_a Chain a, bS1m [Chlamydomonas reinhardtii]|eukprot:XP_001702491.1 predicted protein [Chlamydomonas reinhardtii]
MRARRSPAINTLDAQLQQADASPASAPSPSSPSSAPLAPSDLDDVLCRHTLRLPKPASTGQEAALRLLSRFNGALPSLRGQTILAKVLSVDSERVTVDTGYNGVAEVPRADVSIAHVHTADGAAPVRPTTSDVRPGDLLRLRVDAPYTPYGDMQLTAVREESEFKRRLAWGELRRAMEAGQPVSGRVLNDCVGGFAVGVAGFVAFLPSAMAARDTTQRVGSLQSFRIVAMDEARRRITLRDAGVAAAGFRRVG